jgi:hypothetical protein
MLKKTITYEDYDGNTRTEDLYFFISKSELTEMELSTPGGLTKKLESITKSQNGSEIMKVFKDIILKAYGEKADDGRGFIKKRNGVLLAEEFEQTAAYDALFTELLMDPDKAAAFINGIMPKDLIEAANKQNLQAKTTGLPSGNN